VSRQLQHQLTFDNEELYPWQRQQSRAGLLLIQGEEDLTVEGKEFFLMGLTNVLL